MLAQVEGRAKTLTKISEPPQVGSCLGGRSRGPPVDPEFRKCKSHFGRDETTKSRNAGIPKRRNMKVLSYAHFILLHIVSRYSFATSKALGTTKYGFLRLKLHIQQEHQML